MALLSKRKDPGFRRSHRIRGLDVDLDLCLSAMEMAKQSPTCGGWCRNPGKLPFIDTSCDVQISYIGDPGHRGEFARVP